ncbi:hypothetical protein [Salibacterium aidingense]|uniref:hypothetical protein n=1 Tax=Salibacterium aidingense TaxID=384933 RepID=UPI003BCCA3D2
MSGRKCDIISANSERTNEMSAETTQLLYALLDGQKEIAANVKSLDERMNKVEGRLGGLESKVDGLEKGQEEIKERLSNVESGLDILALKDWHHEKDIHVMKKQLEHAIKD